MIKGSIVALITPMDERGDVDRSVAGAPDRFSRRSRHRRHRRRRHHRRVRNPRRGEHCAVIARCVELAAGRIPVIAGTGANATAEAIRLTRCARDAGADAALLVTPYYNKPTQAGLIAHYSAVAEAVDIPQILYNVPGRTACDLLPETAGALASVPNIVGIKDATGDLNGSQLRALCGDDFALYSGDDATGCEFMLRGGDGVISVTSNVAPRLMAEMCARPWPVTAKRPWR
jgi:4-hydroxy-tetrahydrodipicolinate synthase